MGLLANPRRVEAMERLTADAVSKGAQLRTGGRRLGNSGNFYAPTVLCNTPKDAKVMNEEPFGPLAIINRFHTFDEAIEEAQASLRSRLLRVHPICKDSGSCRQQNPRRHDVYQSSRIGAPGDPVRRGQRLWIWIRGRLGSYRSLSKYKVCVAIRSSEGDHSEVDTRN